MIKHGFYLTFLIVFFMAFPGCKKEDTTPPTIALNEKDSTTIYRILNHGTYTEPGATASDNLDGNITSSIKITGTPNMNLAGTYTITYTVSDAAGNTNTANRFVIVYNQASLLFAGVGNYLSSGILYRDSSVTVVGGAFKNFTQTISFSSTINNTILFSMFAGDTNNTMITAQIRSGDSIIIPSQLVQGIGPSLNDFHTFHGIGLFPGANGSKLSLDFFDLNTTKGTNTEIKEWLN